MAIMAELELQLTSETKPKEQDLSLNMKRQQLSSLPSKIVDKLLTSFEGVPAAEFDDMLSCQKFTSILDEYDVSYKIKIARGNKKRSKFVVMPYGIGR